jgi:hypothetical protein
MSMRTIPNLAAWRRCLPPLAALMLSCFALVLFCFAYPTPAAADPPPATCTQFDVPVSLNVVIPARDHVQLCVPVDPRHTAIQVLLPGATYNSYRNAGQCSALQGGGEGPRWEGRQGPSSALSWAVLLLDVLLHDAWWCAAHGAGEVRA